MISTLETTDGSVRVIKTTITHDAPATTDGARGATRPTFVLSQEEKRWVALNVPEEEQEELRDTLAYLKRIHGATNQQREMRAIAGSPKNKLRRGFSVQSLTRKYYDYRKANGDFHILLDKTKVPATKQGLPDAFIKFFQKLCENNQRCCAGGMRELMHVWKHRRSFDGKTEYRAIPGYDEWPEAEPHTCVPDGWTERNLYRYVPEEFHLTLARQGRAAASAHRLKVYRTRAGLHVCEFVQFDDHEFNVKVNFPGQSKAMRPRGFLATDVLSAYSPAHSLKPTLWDEEEEVKKTLTENDMMWFVINFLCGTGYRADEFGTALCVEHGTAAIRDAFEQRIHDATDGRVRVERSGKFGTEGGGRLAVLNQFKGQAKGNFRFKALIESQFNLIDNLFAALPGQVGKDRNHAPEQLHGADAYNNKLLKLEKALPPEVAAQLLKPFLSWNEFCEASLRCFEFMGNTDKHECEGWSKCGFEVKEWRLNASSEWLPEAALLKLPAAEQQVAGALIRQSEFLSRVRRMSRREAFLSRRGELTRLPEFHWPTLMGIEHALRNGEGIEPKQGVFCITLPFVDDALRFKAVDEHGQRLTDKYVCFVNPFNPMRLVACDAKLRVKAICPVIDPSCYNDMDGIRKQMGDARSWEARELTEFHVKHKEEIAAKEEMHRHNAEIFGGKQPTKAELKEQRELQQLADGAVEVNRGDAETRSEEHNINMEDI